MASRGIDLHSVATVVARLNLVNSHDGEEQDCTSYARWKPRLLVVDHKVQGGISVHGRVALEHPKSTNPPNTIL